MQIRVYYEDTDTSGFVYHSNYLKFCERARSELFFQKGLSPINGDSHFVVKKIEAEFIKSAKLSDILIVKTLVSEIRGASLKLIQNIYRNNELIFEAKILLAHLKGEKVSKITHETLEFFTNFKNR